MSSQLAYALFIIYAVSHSSASRTQISKVIQAELTEGVDNTNDATTQNIDSNIGDKNNEGEENQLGSTVWNRTEMASVTSMIEKKAKKTKKTADECDLTGCDPADASSWNPMLICKAKCAMKKGCAWDSDEGCESRGTSMLEKNAKKKKTADECDLTGCDPADASSWNPMLICKAKCAMQKGCAWDSDEGCESRGTSMLEKNAKKKKKQKKKTSGDCDLTGCDPADASSWNPMLICKAKCAMKKGCRWDSDEGCESR